MTERVKVFVCPKCGSVWSDTEPFECVYCEDGTLVVDKGAIA